MKNKEKKETNIEINKSAKFETEIIETIIAGIVLTGNEIKSIRLKQVSIKESYVLARKNECFVFNMHVSPYKNAFVEISKEFDTRKKRKLLLKKHEIRKISKQSKEKGLIIVPIRIFINERGFAKLEIALARKLKKYQIKLNIKEKEIKREILKNKSLY